MNDQKLADEIDKSFIENFKGIGIALHGVDKNESLPICIFVNKVEK